MTSQTTTPLTGKLNLPVLYNFWERHISQLKNHQKAKIENFNWAEEMRMINGLSLGLDETLHFLLFNQPAYVEFEAWVLQKNNGQIAEEKLSQLRVGINTTGNTLNEDVLSAEDLRFWNENGYLVLKQVISKEQTEATVKAICEFLQADPSNPETWYLPHEEQRGLMYLFYHHPALDNNRQSARIRKAYEQIYGSNEIFVSTDKISFNPPETAHHKFKGSALHWDTSLIAPIPMDLQGLLYLNDVEAEDGAFQCVPGFHHKIDAWLQQLPDDSDPREIALKELKPVSVPGKAGDFIIWHQALPHCASPNRGNKPRLVQYITWHLTNRKIHSEWR